MVLSLHREAVSLRLNKVVHRTWGMYPDKTCFFGKNLVCRILKPLRRIILRKICRNQRFRHVICSSIVCIGCWSLAAIGGLVMIYPNKFRNLELLDLFLQWVCYISVFLSLIFLLQCLYHSFNRKTFTKTPTQLLGAVELTRLRIDKEPPCTWKSKQYDELARQMMLPLSDEPYRTEAWFRPLWDYRLRAEPRLYPAQSLRPRRDLAHSPCFRPPKRSILKPMAATIFRNARRESKDIVGLS